ncbi:MAG: hypothetical protein IT380_29195 [Myxococcales bacterium]|nr:hypothetical protein [Myxococcales bacterium]
MRLTLLVVLLAVPAQAAHLLDEESRLVPASVPQPLTDATLRPDSLTATADDLGFGEHFAKTAGVGVLASTAGVLIAVPLGMLSNELVWTALPVLISHLFIPPGLTVLAAWLIGKVSAPGRYGFWGAFGAAFAVHAAAFVVASLALTVPWTNPVALLLYTLVDGLLMSGTSVGFMHLFPNEKKAPATVTSFVPGVSDTVFVPASTVAF